MRLNVKFYVLMATLLCGLFGFACTSAEVAAPIVLENADAGADSEESVELVEDEPEPPATAILPTATAVPATATPEPVSQLGDRIEIKSSGFSVQPPADFILDLEDPEGVEMLAHEGASEHGPAIAVFGGEFGDEMTADQMYQFMVEADEFMQNVVRSPATMEGAEGFVAEFDSEDGGVQLKGKIILNLIGGQGTIVTAAAPADEWGNGFSDTVDLVAASIEMFPPVTE